jgi:hypothetical protein
VSASAFTTATVERDATVSMETDTNGVIQLEAGTVNGISNTGDELQIELTDLNTNGEFVFGNPSDPTSTYAINITNSDGDSHDFSAKYAIESDPAEDTDNVEFATYNGSGDSVANFTEGATWNDLTNLSDGDSLYVVLTINTTDVSSENALDGTLHIRAN